MTGRSLLRGLAASSGCTPARGAARRDGPGARLVPAAAARASLERRRRRHHSSEDRDDHDRDRDPVDADLAEDLLDARCRRSRRRARRSSPRRCRRARSQNTNVAPAHRRWRPRATTPTPAARRSSGRGTPPSPPWRSKNGSPISSTRWRSSSKRPGPLEQRAAAAAADHEADVVADDRGRRRRRRSRARSRGARRRRPGRRRSPRSRPAPAPRAPRSPTNTAEQRVAEVLGDAEDAGKHADGRSLGHAGAGPLASTIRLPRPRRRSQPARRAYASLMRRRGRISIGCLCALAAAACVAPAASSLRAPRLAPGVRTVAVPAAGAPGRQLAIRPASSGAERRPAAPRPRSSPRCAPAGSSASPAGPSPVTIRMRATAKVVNTSPRVVLDGGGLVTLSGEGRRRILYMDTCDPAQVWTTSHCQDQPSPAARRPEPDVHRRQLDRRSDFDGGGGGAIFDRGGRLRDRQLHVHGQPLRARRARHRRRSGAGAVAVRQPPGLRRATAASRDNVCSNGGALSSIGVSWTVLDSRFAANRAIGAGANPARPGTPGGGSGGAIYNDGDQMTLSIARQRVRRQPRQRGRRRDLLRQRRPQRNDVDQRTARSSATPTPASRPPACPGSSSSAPPRPAIGDCDPALSRRRSRGAGEGRPL